MLRALVIVFLLVILVTFCQAVECEGDEENACNGLLNKCTSEGGLCVIDSTTRECCLLSYTSLSSSRSSTSCISNMDASICDNFEVMTEASTATYVDTQTSPTLLPTTTSKPTEECFVVEIGIILDDNPGEISWEISSGRKSTLEHPSATVLSSSPYYDPERYRQASDVHSICLPEGRYTFTIIDNDEGDGLCCSHGEGRYVVSYQTTGEMITQGATFNTSESTSFQIPYVAPTYLDLDGDGVDDRTKNVIPTTPLTSTGLLSCTNTFELYLVTDDYGVETTWELRERDDEHSNYTDWKIVASGGPYLSNFTYDLMYCLNPGKYAFVFYDWQCDGLVGVKHNGHYNLKVNGIDVYTGGTKINQYEEVVNLEFMNSLEEYDGDGLYGKSNIRHQSNNANEIYHVNTWIALISVTMLLK